MRDRNRPRTIPWPRSTRCSTKSRSPGCRASPPRNARASIAPARSCGKEIPTPAERATARMICRPEKSRHRRRMSAGKISLAPPDILDWGRTRYEDAWRQQDELVAGRLAEEIGDTLVFTEHEPVFTLGLRAGAEAHLV